MSDPTECLAEMERLSGLMDAALDSGDHERATALASAISQLVDDTFGPLPAEELSPAYGRLRDAIELGDVDRVIDALPGLDLNAPQGAYGTFPLIWAMQSEGRAPELVALLLDGGARADFAMTDGPTALHFVSDHAHSESDAEKVAEIVGLLVAAGADIEARQQWGWTPLQRAVMEGSPLEMDALLRHGADPNARFSTTTQPGCAAGLTPLMVAGAETPKVKILLAHGANPSLTNSQGQNAVQYLTREAEKTWDDLTDKIAKRIARPFDRVYAEGLRRSATLVSCFPAGRHAHS